MLIIDTHTHVFPDSIAYDTVKGMAENAEIPLFTDGTINGLIQVMDKYSVNYSAIMPVATKPEQVESINNWIQSNKSERIIPFGAIHPDFHDPVKELERICELGFKGIKLHPDYQVFYPTEERMKIIYETCGRLGLIILFHSGDDIGHPRPGHALPRILSRVVDEYPDQTFIFAHMGGFEVWDQTERYLIGRNVYLDTSYSFDYTSKERVFSMIKNHGPERILLGSDSPWGDIGKEIENIISLDLAEDEKSGILGLNAAGLYGIKT